MLKNHHLAIRGDKIHKVVYANEQDYIFSRCSWFALNSRGEVADLGKMELGEALKIHKGLTPCEKCFTDKVLYQDRFIGSK